MFNNRSSVLFKKLLNLQYNDEKKKRRRRLLMANKKKKKKKIIAVLKVRSTR